MSIDSSQTRGNAQMVLWSAECVKYSKAYFRNISRIIYISFTIVCVNWYIIRMELFRQSGSRSADLEVVSNVRKKRHILRRLLLLMLLAAVGWIGYMYLAPLMKVEAIISYADYTVERGSIATSTSFSASISVASSETHQNTSRATSIREIYVKSGQEVKAGDKLMLLDNGEVLKAGLDGVVTDLRFDTTDWLWNNVQLIQISDLTNLKVSLSVDEYDVRNVAAGQKCIVTIIPLGLDFETEISHVDRVSASSGQVAHYTASAELTVPSNVLPGMTASVTIPAETAEDVLLLDMAALAFDEDKKPYVLRRHREGDEYVRVPVTTGLSDGMRVEIISGLNEGETVWAVSGTEEDESKFSLTEIYKQLVGEKIVINDLTGGNDRGGSRMTPMRDDARTETQDMFVPGGMLPEGMTPDGRMPDWMPSASPSATSQPEERTEETAPTSEPDAAVTEMPARTDVERKETP